MLLHTFRSCSKVFRIASRARIDSHQGGLSQLHALQGFLRGVKKNANELRPGNVVQIDGKLCLVSKFHYTQGMSRQLGNVQLELRDIQSGTKVSQRYRPADPVEVTILEDRKYNCLYVEGNAVHLMDPETYEQVSADISIFGEAAVYLQEEMPVEISFHGGQPITGVLPKSVEVRVIETDPPSGADSVNARFKPAVIEAGIKTSVPTFIKQNDLIVVNTADGSFVRRLEKSKF